MTLTLVPGLAVLPLRTSGEPWKLATPATLPQASFHTGVRVWEGLTCLRIAAPRLQAGCTPLFSADIKCLKGHMLPVHAASYHALLASVIHTSGSATSCFQCIYSYGACANMHAGVIVMRSVMHVVQMHAPRVMRWSGPAPRRPGVSGHCRANSTTAPPPKQYLHSGRAQSPSSTGCITAQQPSCCT